MPSYKTVVQDFIRRWCYPLVPESEIYGERSCSYQRGDIYCHSTVALDYTTVIKRHTLIEEGCRIGERTEIGRSCIGRRCTIDDNVTITETIIMDEIDGDPDAGCHICSGCVINNCIIGRGVTIGANCTISNCVLGHNVVVNSDNHLEYQFIHNCENAGEDDDTEQDTSVWTKTPIDGKGYVIANGCFKLFREKDKELLWSASRTKDCQGFETDNEDDEDDDGKHMKESYQQLKEYIVKYLQYTSSMDDICMEINCYRMSINCDYKLIISNLVYIMLDSIWKDNWSHDDWLSQLANIKTVLKQYFPIFRRFFNRENYETVFLNSFWEYSVIHPSFQPFCGMMIEVMWNEKMISDNEVLIWYNNVITREGEGEYDGIRDIVEEDRRVRSLVSYLEDDEDDESESSDSTSSTDSSDSEDSEESTNGSEDSSSNSSESDDYCVC